MRRRPQIDFESAMTLIDAGRRDSEIARVIGVPRRTISAWRHGRGSAYHRRLAAAHPDWRPPNAASYSYLLGLYLGDGCLVTSRGAPLGLIVTLDASYPGIVEQTVTAMTVAFPVAPVRTFARMEGSVTAVQVNDPCVPYAFPQHGAGKKHLRRIELVDWQLEITRAYPWELLRGLIHSDGCHTVNRFKTKLPSGRVAAYEYPRYFFSNLSDDIREIFCDHCDLLGIRWTQSNPRNISISYRRSVVLLDEFIGPKW
jgi:hypothetical protein